MTPAEDTLCKRCASNPEIVGEVVGGCPAGRGARICHHDRIVDTIEAKERKGGHVIAREELFWPVGAGNWVAAEPLRLDFVIKKRDSALVAT